MTSSILQEVVGYYGYGVIPGLLWNGFKNAWSATSRQRRYEEQSELIILWAYETASRFEINGQHDSTISEIIDEIMDFKDDPKYTLHSTENYAHVIDLAKRRGAANLAFVNEQPEQHAQRVRRNVAHIYGLEDLDKEVAKVEGVWKRISDLNVEQRKAELRTRGPDIDYVLSYESRVKDHLITIQAVKQVESEGLIYTTKLFSKGGTHESVSRDVEAFDRLLYAEWESGLKTKNERERRKAFREFLAYRTKVWG